MYERSSMYAQTVYPFLSFLIRFYRIEYKTALIAFHHNNAYVPDYLLPFFFPYIFDSILTT